MPKVSLREGSPALVKAGDLLTVRVDRLANEGSGVARHSGLVLFVPYSAPGDELEVVVTNVKKRFATARISKIVKASAHRTEPRCEVFGRCGGCSWQHLAYAEQLTQKQQIIEHALRAFEVQTDPIVASPSPWHYRNRIAVHRRGREVGFYARHSHRLVDTPTCKIADALLNERLSELRRDGAKGAQGRIELVRKNAEIVESRQEQSEEFGFAQVNSAQNSQLQDYVVSLFEPEGRVLDLYCGNGNLSLPLSERYPKLQIIGVELNHQAVVQAQARATPQMHFIESDVESYLAGISTLENQIVLLDPPRGGCSALVSALLCKLKPAKIVYVSCDLATFSRDVKLLQEWRLTHVRPFDMFPQTSHIELVGQFDRPEKKFV